MSRLATFFVFIFLITGTQYVDCKQLKLSLSRKEIDPADNVLDRSYISPPTRADEGLSLQRNSLTVLSEDQDAREEAHLTDGGIHEGLDNFYDLQYNLLLDFGSQEIEVQLDTGSAHLWVMKKGANTRKKTFNPENEPSYREHNKSMTLHYGGGSASGKVATIDLKVGQEFIKEQEFLAIHEAEIRLNTAGIVGVGYNALSRGRPTIIDNMKKQGIIDEKVFTVYLTGKEGRDGGQVVFGIADESYAKEPFNYVKLTKNSYYQIRLDKMKFGDVTFLGQQGILDTGTSYIVVPQELHDAYKKIVLTADPKCSASVGSSKIACPKSSLHKLPDFSIQLEDRVYTLKPDDYMRASGNRYVLQFGTLNSGLVILGDTFLRRFVSVYDQERNRIGLAGRYEASAQAPRVTYADDTSKIQNTFFGQTVFGLALWKVILIMGAASMVIFGLITYFIYRKLTRAEKKGVVATLENPQVSTYEKMNHDDQVR